MATDDEPTRDLPQSSARGYPFDDDDESVFSSLSANDDGDAWPERPRRRGLTMRVPTAVLGALVIAAGAFWVGAIVQKSDGTTTASGISSAASRFRSLFRASGSFGRGGGSTPAGATSFGAAATGILTDVKGNTLYLTDASGKLVTVTISQSTAITRESAATPATLQLGDTIVVRGATASSGVVRATSVVASAKGVSTAAGAVGTGAVSGSSAGGSAFGPSGAQRARGRGTSGG
ncbi:MAG: hypothetical protein M0004_08440 [Actinomycetota bacterium]|nr:hypothetical protein [Actinomycetota bacterium]